LYCNKIIQTKHHTCAEAGKVIYREPNKTRTYMHIYIIYTPNLTTAIWPHDIAIYNLIKVTCERYIYEQFGNIYILSKSVDAYTKAKIRRQ
jgi:hypothetical protein